MPGRGLDGQNGIEVGEGLGRWALRVRTKGCADRIAATPCAYPISDRRTSTRATRDRHGWPIERRSLSAELRQLIGRRCVATSSKATQLVNVLTLGGEFDELVGRRPVPAVGEPTQLVEVATLRRQLDELISRRPVPAISEATQLVEVSTFGSKFDQLVRGIPVAVLGASMEGSQIGLSHAGFLVIRRTSGPAP